MFMADLHTAAYEALQLADEADLAKSAPPVTATARLQGFDDNLASLQSRIITDPGRFSSLSVPDFLMLDRLNFLRSQAQRVIAAPDRSGFSGYFEDAADMMELLADQPGVKEIIFCLGTLQGRLRESPVSLPRAGPQRSGTTASQEPSGHVNVFVAAGKAGRAGAEELAYRLGNNTVGETQVKVLRSWDAGALSQHPLFTARTRIEGCRYGALVLVAEEATVDVNAGNIITGRLRLSADVEFLLGLMVGFFGMARTFLVLPQPQNDQPELATLLQGLTPASYDPADVDRKEAMSQACTTIIWAIERQEQQLAAAHEKAE
jgi:hypothetical protein